MSAWSKLPANLSKGVKFQRDNSFMRFCRYYLWHYCWSGRQYGLQYNDWAFEPDPEVKEALRRFRIKDPYHYDLRLQRMLLASQLGSKNERLPKDMWTKWDDETFYLKPYLEEIEAEKLERVASTGIKPGYLLKEYH